MYVSTLFVLDTHEDAKAEDKRLLQALVIDGHTCDTCDRPEDGSCPRKHDELRGPFKHFVCVYHSASCRALPSEVVRDEGGVN